VVFEQLDFKSEYEQIVMTYNRKLLLYAKTLCGSKDHAEEIAQEALLMGFQHFGSLKDRKKVFPWLKTIAKRIYLRKYYPNKDYDFNVSIDAPISDDNDLKIADIIVDDSIDIEEKFERNELCRYILDEIDNLSQKQRDSVLFRYFYGYSVRETAASLKMTDNSVKVSSHIGLEKVKERLKNYFIKGDYIMNCKEAYAYLHQYAKGKISDREKEDVGKHINICKECRDIAESLAALSKYIKPAQDREHRNYVAHFQLPEHSLEYVTVNMEVEGYREVNEKIEEWGGDIPFESIYLRIPGFNFTFAQTDFTREMLAEFGDDGFRLPYDEIERADNFIKYRYTKMNKISNPHELAIVYISKEKKLNPSIEHPDLIYGYARNWARRECGGKIGVYLAVPSGGKNLRIKQGDEIADCGAYKFVYADRHVLYNECVTVNCSYIN